MYLVVQETNGETGKSWKTVSAQSASKKREEPDIRNCYWMSEDLRGTGQNRGQWVQASLMSQAVLSESPWEVGVDAMTVRKEEFLTAHLSSTLCFSFPTLCQIESQAGDLSAWHA